MTTNEAVQQGWKSWAINKSQRGASAVNLGVILCHFGVLYRSGVFTPKIPESGHYLPKKWTRIRVPLDKGVIVLFFSRGNSQKWAKLSGGHEVWKLSWMDHLCFVGNAAVGWTAVTCAIISSVVFWSTTVGFPPSALLAAVRYL